MTLRARLRRGLRRLGRPAHKSSDLEANKDVRRATSAGDYVFKGGLVWKGGVNSSASRITERPPPPEPLGTTGGVKPDEASRRQPEGEASTGDGTTSD